MVHWSPFVMSFKKKYPWIQLAGHAGNGTPLPPTAFLTDRQLPWETPRACGQNRSGPAHYRGRKRLEQLL